MGTVWFLVTGGLDAAYIWSHGVNAAPIAYGIVSVAPIWTFIAKEFVAKIFGLNITIKAPELCSTFRTASDAGRGAVEQAEAIARQFPSGSRREAFSERLAFWNTEPPVASFTPVRELHADSNLALVSVRIAIELRVRAIAKALSMGNERSVTRLISLLGRSGVFTEEFSDALNRLVAYGGEAADGATVDADAQSIVAEAQNVFRSLEKILKVLALSSRARSFQEQAGFGVCNTLASKIMWLQGRSSHLVLSAMIMGNAQVARGSTKSAPQIRR
jgi:hypothetical protein